MSGGGGKGVLRPNLPKKHKPAPPKSGLSLPSQVQICDPLLSGLSLPSQVQIFDSMLAGLSLPSQVQIVDSLCTLIYLPDSRHVQRLVFFLTQYNEIKDQRCSQEQN